MALIQCLLGAASPVLSSQTYVFERDHRGRFVCEVFDLVHIQCLLSRDDIYREVKDTPEKPIETHIETLLGSSVLPSMIDLGEGPNVQLGTVVARAHKESGLSISDWNALTNDAREALLTETVEAMKAEIAPKAPKTEPTPAPAPVPAPEPEAAAPEADAQVEPEAPATEPEAEAASEPDEAAADSVLAGIVTEAVVKPATAPRRGRRRN